MKKIHKLPKCLVKIKMTCSLNILECLWKNNSLTTKTNSKFFISLSNSLGLIIDYNKCKWIEYLLSIQFFNNNNHKYLSHKSNTHNCKKKDSNSLKTRSDDHNNSKKSLEQTSFATRYLRRNISWISSLTSVAGLVMYFLI